MKHLIYQTAFSLILIASACKNDKCTSSITTKKIYMLSNEEGNKNKKYIRLYVNDETYLLGDTNFSYTSKDMEIENSNIYVLATKTNLQTFASEYIVFKNGQIIQKFPNTSSFIPTALVISGNDILIAGTGQDNGSKSKLKLWKNGVITEITQGIATDAFCSDMIIDKSDVYIAGSETLDSLEIRVAKYWKNGSPVSFEQSAEIKRIVKFNNEIYCSGVSGGLPCYWNNGEITTLGNDKGQCVGITFKNNLIQALVSSVASGKYQTSLWNNSTSTALTDANSHPEGSFGTELIYTDTEIIAAGGIFNPNETVSPVIWKNGKIQLMPVTTGTQSFISKIIYK